MINKLIIDDTNVELNDKSPIPYSYVFAQANTHVVKYGIDNTDEICAYAFKDCTYLSYIAFPPEIKNIKRYAFAGCTSLERVPLGENVEYLGKGVFDGCTSLKEIDFERTTPPLAYCTFPAQTILYVPDGEKYEEIAYERMNQDRTVEYFTQNPYSKKYEKMFDVTAATSEGTYFRNKWDALGDDAHVVEYKNRTPVLSIEMVNTVQIPANTRHFALTYTLMPEDATNKTLHWYSRNEDYLTVEESPNPGEIWVNSANISAGQVGLTAYAESGVSYTTTFRFVS